MKFFTPRLFTRGIKFRLVMYKSGGPATADLMGGHIDACELGVGTAGYQAARKGDLFVLANLGTSEVPYIAGVPKLRDMGYPFATSLMYGFAFPKGPQRPFATSGNRLLPTS